MEVMEPNPVVEARTRNRSGMATRDILGRMMALQLKLEKKNEALSRTRLKLARAKKDIGRLRGIVSYQRDRIVQLQLSRTSPGPS